MKKTIEKALYDIRSLREQLERQIAHLNGLDSDLDALASSLPEDPEDTI